VSSTLEIHVLLKGGNVRHGVSNEDVSHVEGRSTWSGIVEERHYMASESKNKIPDLEGLLRPQSFKLNLKKGRSHLRWVSQLM
jgi:hypothetical protein